MEKQTIIRISHLLYFLFAIVFIWVGSQLFFEDGVTRLVNAFGNVFVGADGEERDNLRILYPEEVANLEPTVLLPSVRQRTLNIYEPLVRADRNFNIRPALALSWGLVDDLTWEFKLRPNVVFHDGSRFDVQDAVASLDRALAFAGSQARPLLKSLDEVEVVDDYTLRLKTTVPDPLMLQRLSFILIIPSEHKNLEQMTPIGTAPYKFRSWKIGEELVLESFDGYWGSSPRFGQITVLSQPDKSRRVNMLLSGEADFLAFAPFDAVEALTERGFSLATVPSLELHFLLFNMNSELFEDVRNRELFSLAIDQRRLVDVLGTFARPVNQYVSNGIFGFTPYLREHVYDPYQAKTIAETTGLHGQTIHLHLSKGQDILGEHVRLQMAAIGVNAVVSYMDMDQFSQSIESGLADIYFLGFKADAGDASDFFASLVHTAGDSNVGNYSNSVVDVLIETSLFSMDPVLRLESLQEAMRIIVEEDIFGVPLFEYETVYAFDPTISMEPRLDGFIYFDDIIK